MTKKRVRYIPVCKVLPGQQFEHHQQIYRRTTDDEIPRHPANELLRQRGAEKIVLTYMLTRKGGRTPVGFDSDTKVIVREGTNENRRKTTTA